MLNYNFNVNIKLMFLEIKNYFYFLKTIKNAKTTKEWTDLNLRTEGNKIATVINLREEDMGEEEAVRNFKATLIMKPINEYLGNTLDFKEIIYPHMRYIEGTRSFLVLYTFEFEQITYFSLSIVLTPIFLLAGVFTYILW